VVPLILCDLHPKSFRSTLDLFGLKRQTGQFGEQLTAFFKADHGAHTGDHASDGGRKTGVLQTELPVTRTETMATGGTVIIRTHQLQSAENALEDLLASTGIACHLAAPAVAVRLIAVAVVSIETLLDGTGSQLEYLAAYGGFQSFQIDFLQSLTSK
jgi:hypothetical protein